MVIYRSFILNVTIFLMQEALQLFYLKKRSLFPFLNHDSTAAINTRFSHHLENHKVIQFFFHVFISYSFIFLLLMLCCSLGNRVPLHFSLLSVFKALNFNIFLQKDFPIPTLEAPLLKIKLRFFFSPLPFFSHSLLLSCSLSFSLYV